MGAGWSRRDCGAAGEAVYREAGSALAEEFVSSGNYAWNGGIFLWSARTLANAVREHSPAMAPLLERIAAALRDFQGRVRSCFCGGLSAVREHLHRLCRAGAAVGEGRGWGRRSIVCLATLTGTILAAGLRCMSMLPGVAPEKVSVANVFDGDDPALHLDRFDTATMCMRRAR